MLSSITTILMVAGHQLLRAQEVTNEEHFSSSISNTSNQLPSAPSPQQLDPATLPRFTVLAAPSQKAIIESDTQSKHDDTYLLAGDVVITYGDRILRGDTITYNEVTGDIAIQGHLKLTGGENDEYIEASHGTYNLRTNTGRFYDVNGSVGMGSTSVANRKDSFQSSNPFLFSGRLVVKTGPANYDVYDGAVTSCLLPKPDWQLFARHFSLNNHQVTARNSVFRLLGVPLLPLPYVTHPTDTQDRQSGILIPVLRYSSASKDTGSKGFTVGEQIYIALGRSADITVGSLYYTLRGFSENGTFRYRGPGDDFFTAHFSAMQDRGFTATTTDSKGNTVNTYTNQGGEDVTTSFREQITHSTRVVGDAEYLSSYPYREVFTENFNQAVSTDITSLIYLMHQSNGYSLDARADRYQGLKVVPVQNFTGAQVKIFHAPSIDFTADDHSIPGTPLLWSLESSAAGLKRIQPNFVSSGITERLDLRPEISLPLHLQGWNVLASIAARETFYSRSRLAPYGNGALPVELTDPVNRSDIEATIDIRPPVIERTFKTPAPLRWLFGEEVRHTIEPEFTYRDVAGINNFLSILRFDNLDLASDTNELEYGVTQHLYFHPKTKPTKLAAPRPGCPAIPGVSAAAVNDENPSDLPDIFNPDPQATNDANGIPNASATAPDLPTRTHARHTDACAPPPEPRAPQQEWFSWQLGQKYFFDQNFGGAIIDKRRNIFDTTLNFSGVAFLTEERAISPLKSRMRFRTSGHMDIEYDFDYDTGSSRFTSQNVFLDVHESRLFGGFSYARLNAPGRFYTAVINTTTNTATGLTSSATSNFSQMRLLAGYGNPSKPGLSAAGGAGLDLSLASAQYVTLQTSYNWNCCGLTLEYRKYDLGTIRNEGSYSFNFTLANIGSAGNLRRNQTLF